MKIKKGMKFLQEQLSWKFVYTFEIFPATCYLGLERDNYINNI